MIPYRQTPNVRDTNHKLNIASINDYCVTVTHKKKTLYQLCNTKET